MDFRRELLSLFCAAKILGKHNHETTLKDFAQQLTRSSAALGYSDHKYSVEGDFIIMTDISEKEVDK